MVDVILLTACVNPDGMPLTTVSDSALRLNQYLHALEFYLRETSCPVVFVDNSNVDPRTFTMLKSRYGKRLEILVFDGNKDKTRGKGYGEMEIISYALVNSEHGLDKTSCRIMKITGRLVLRNIKSILAMDHWHVYPQGAVVCQMNNEMTFADSRAFIASGGFLQNLVKDKNKIDDMHGVYFEHVLCESIKFQRQYAYSPFFVELAFEGVSGSTGQNYEYQSRSLPYKIRFVDFQLRIMRTFVRNHYTKKTTFLYRVVYIVTRCFCKALRFLCP